MSDKDDRSLYPRLRYTLTCDRNGWLCDVIHVDHSGKETPLKAFVGSTATDCLRQAIDEFGRDDERGSV